MWPFSSARPQAATPDAEPQRKLEDEMRRRWYQTLESLQGELRKSKMESTIGSIRPLTNAAAGSGGLGAGSLAGLTPSSAPVPVSAPAPVAPAGWISPEEHQKQLNELQRKLKAEHEREVGRAKESADRVRQQAELKKTRDEIAECGLARLLERGEQMDRRVADFARLARATAESLRTASRGGFAGQLATDLESLPVALVQLLSRRYYELVRAIRATGGDPIDVRMAHEIGREFASWLKRVPERPLEIEVIMEGADFDDEVCVLADPSRGLGASRKVNPVSFVVGSRRSRVFRKAIVESASAGGA